jgi:hypothetical protein
MRPSDRVQVLERMHAAVLNHAYVMTPHAEMEMRADHLDVIDVESAVLTGGIEAVFEDDPRGRRYEVIGYACDLCTRVGVVVRFAGTMLIITVYEIKS